MIVKKWAIPLVVAVASGMAASQAAAQQGFYVGGSAGLAIVDIDKAATDAELQSVGVGGISSSVDENDTGFKARVGYRFNPNIAVEAGYVNFGKFTYRASFTTPAAGNASQENKIDGWNLDLLGIWPVNNKFSAFGKVGVLFSSVKATARATVGTGTGFASAKESEANPGIGLGVEYSFTPNFSIRAEAERYFGLGKKETTGEGDVSLISVGVNYRF